MSRILPPWWLVREMTLAEAAELLWWRVVVAPVREGYALVRMRLARGRASSRWWSPDVGEVVRYHGRRKAMVTRVRLRDRSVSLVFEFDGELPHRMDADFAHCVDPLD